MTAGSQSVPGSRHWLCCRLVAVGTAFLLLAPDMGLAQGLGGRNSGQPIEITSDRLVVEQEKQIATFSGNVDAVQGDVSLRADQLRVHYARSEDRAEGGDQQSIRRIEAEGNVLLTQPGETAQGQAGVYEVPQGRVMLQGNVVLTRGQNVVRGDRLDMNLNTGVSTVTAAQTSAAGGQRSQRVRALFVPQSNRPQGNATSPPNGAQAGTPATKAAPGKPEPKRQER